MEAGDPEAEREATSSLERRGVVADEDDEDEDEDDERGVEFRIEGLTSNEDEDDDDDDDVVVVNDVDDIVVKS